MVLSKSKCDTYIAVGKKKRKQYIEGTQINRMSESSTRLQDVDCTGGVREEVVVVDEGDVGGGDDLE